MKKLIITSVFYFFLVLITLEIIIRVFHLAKDNPTRFIDNYKVEKWEPNQEGYSVTGNRRQNFSKFRINESGFNSYREFIPTKDNIEIALVGDSFVEGFHQDYNNSIGKKIENSLHNNVKVYEYGYAGYDFADQLHLINVYKHEFDLIDYVFIYLNYEDDLSRGEYKVNNDRMFLESPLNKALKKIKLLVYAQNIGALDPVKGFVSKLISVGNSHRKFSKDKVKKKTDNIDEKSIINFKSLVDKLKYDKSRFVLFFEGDKTSKKFMNYLNTNKFKYLDLSRPFKSSKAPITLIYDKHWNNRGREIVAQNIVDYYNQFKK